MGMHDEAAATTECLVVLRRRFQYGSWQEIEGTVEIIRCFQAYTAE